MSQAEQLLNEWKEQQELAEQILVLIGKLYRDRGVILRMYGRPLMNVSTIEIIKAHLHAKQLQDQELKLADTHAVLQQLVALRPAAVRVDLGKLTHGWLNSDSTDINAYVSNILGEISGVDGKPLEEPQDVVLYGFGRIGRLLARLLIERTGGGQKLRLRAIVVRKGSDNDLDKRASLLRRDSVHGPFSGSIRVDHENNAIIANGNFIKVIYASDPATIDYTTYGIGNALIVDNTGKWRDEEGLRLHLQSTGASKVLLTAPGKGDIKNIVFGVNSDTITAEDTILSAASCTTNAITPVLKVLNDDFGVEVGHVETVHSYTNDQNLIDNYHKGDRRGRSAALNMVMTETGAAKAVAKALPELAGKLSGNAIRVPTPNVSLAILNLTLAKPATAEGINDRMRIESLSGPLRDQIDYTTSTELVSTDLVGSRHAGVIDATATLANGKNVVVYVWYDNEFGYSCQVIRVMQQMAGVKYPEVNYS